jgi:hypothetical protein
MGPGTVVHHEPSGLFPAENNTVFFRPKSGIAAKTDLGRFRLVGAYVARDQADTGQIGVNELTAQLVGDFDPIRISLQPRYLISHNAKRDALAELGLDLVPNEHITSSLLLSAGDFSAGTSGLYVKALASINNLAHLGNYLTLRFDKVGSKYRIKELDKYEFVFLNNFERYILDGTADLGVSFKQELFNGFSLEWMSDYVTDGSFNYGENYPETYYLWQASLAKLFFPAVRMNLFYRAYNVPSGIAQFADAVPTVSNVIGLGAFCAF